MSFDSVPEQDEAKRLLRSALAEGPAHAYLFHGPAGIGKRATALAFAAELLGNDPRVERRSHPDLYVLELNLHAVRGVLPDRTYLLLVDPAESARRVGKEGDRIEREDDDFRARVDVAYRQLAEVFPQRIHVIDGTRPPREIAEEVLDELRQRS